MSSKIPDTLHKNINTVAMLMRDALLRHFRKQMYHGGDKRLRTLISYVLLVAVTRSVEEHTKGSLIGGQNNTQHTQDCSYRQHAAVNWVWCV